MFFGVSNFALKWFDVKINQMKTLQVDREVFQALDLNGESCNESLAYARYDCIHKELKKEVNKIGCYAPFGPYKTDSALIRQILS